MQLTDMTKINGNTLVGLRKARKLTQSQVAKQLGISVSHLSDVENDRKGVSVHLLYKLSKLYNVTMEDLINGNG